MAFEHRFLSTGRSLTLRLPMNFPRTTVDELKLLREPLPPGTGVCGSEVVRAPGCLRAGGRGRPGEPNWGSLGLGYGCLHESPSINAL